MAEDVLRKLRPLHGVSRSCPPSALSSKHRHGLPWPSAKIAAVHVAPIPARTSATTARMLTRPSIIRLPDDLPLLTGGQRGALPVTQTGLFPTADCHLCSPDLTRVIRFHGLSLSHLRSFNQQPRGLCLLFILTILFRAPKIVTDVHNLYPSLFQGAGFFWGELRHFMQFYMLQLFFINFLFLTFSSTYLIYVLSLFT